MTAQGRNAAVDSNATFVSRRSRNRREYPSCNSPIARPCATLEFMYFRSVAELILEYFVVEQTHLDVAQRVVVPSAERGTTHRVAEPQ